MLSLVVTYSSLWKLSFDLYLPGSKRFCRSVQLYGPIDPEASSYKYYGTKVSLCDSILDTCAFDAIRKVELILKKQDTRSWAVLEKTDYAVPVSLTFGVGGRTGTIGAKELVLDDQNAKKVTT